MKEKTTTQATAPVTEEAVKTKAGRKVMTSAEKEAAAKARALEKEKAKNMRPEIFVQYQGSEIGVDDVVEAVKKSFREEKKRTPITSLKMYVKPEDRAVYYVINEKFEGKLEL